MLQSCSNRIQNLLSLHDYSTILLELHRVAAFSVKSIMHEPWSKPVTMKNLFLETGWDWTLSFHMERLGSICGTLVYEVEPFVGRVYRSPQNARALHAWAKRACKAV